MLNFYNMIPFSYRYNFAWSFPAIK